MTPLSRKGWIELCLRPPVILDGAWGSLLQQRGLPAGTAPEAWNLTHPGEVLAAGKAYVQAGSQIILTNTFGGTQISLARHGLAEQTFEINRTGAELSKRAAGSEALVFGSIGPTGTMLMMGEITSTRMSEAFLEQANALKEGGADGLVIETMSDLEEAVLATRAAAATGLPVVSCMVFDSGPQNHHTMMGITPAQAADAFEKAGAWAVGANCGRGPDDFLPLCHAFRAATRLPLWMKPNAGLPEIEDGKTVYRMTAGEFAELVRPLWEQGGAAFIGGCCGTDPSFIHALQTNPPA
ncbi:MAG: methionine synthase [Balneolaceae bacterium]|nr:MAG: methionine synthase [Balneolaceae bacterium]